MSAATETSSEPAATEPPTMTESSTEKLATENPAAKAIFDRYDKDGTGQIDSKELQAMCNAMGRQLTEAEAAVAVKRLDKGGDGVISFTEFMEWWRIGLDTTAIKEDSIAHKRMEIDAAKAQAVEQRDNATRDASDSLEDFRAQRAEGSEMVKSRPQRRSLVASRSVRERQKFGLEEPSREERAATAIAAAAKGKQARDATGGAERGRAVSTVAPLMHSPSWVAKPEGGRVAVFRQLCETLVQELEADLAAGGGIGSGVVGGVVGSRWEPLRQLAGSRLDVDRYARQTLALLHAQALEPLAAHDQRKRKADAASVKDATLLQDDATLLRTLRGALSAKRAIAGWPDGLERLRAAAKLDAAGLLEATRLPLRSARLGPEGAGALGVLLQASTKLRYLDASSCSLGVVGVVALAQAMRGGGAATALLELHASGNDADERSVAELRAAATELEAREGRTLLGDAVLGMTAPMALPLTDVSRGGGGGGGRLTGGLGSLGDIEEVATPRETMTPRGTAFDMVITPRVHVPLGTGTTPPPPPPPPMRASSSALKGGAGAPVNGTALDRDSSSAGGNRQSKKRVSLPEVAVEMTKDGAPPPPPPPSDRQSRGLDRRVSSLRNLGMIAISARQASAGVVGARNLKGPLEKRPSGKALVHDKGPGLISRIFGKKEGHGDPAALLRLFIEGPENSLSAHVERMAEIVAVLQNAGELPAVPVEGASLYEPFGRSCDVLLAMHRALRPKLAIDKHKRLLSVLHARLDASARYWDTAAASRSPSTAISPRGTKGVAAGGGGGGDDAGAAAAAAAAAGRGVGEKNGALRVLVAGGGPVGLRAAVEMALLGHKVVVLESRDDCRRLNVLKMWEETIADFERLGLGYIDPDYSNGRDLRASTSRLQLAMLKAALLLGVEVRVGQKVSSLVELDGYDVLLLATGFQRKLLATFADEATHIDELDGAGFVEAPVPDKQSAAIAIVAHFEYSDRTDEAKQWTRAFEAFDWTLQDARGANDAAQLKKMQAQYGLYCIAPSTLEADKIQLENIVCYRNRGYRKRDAKGDISLENCLGVPPSFYFIFTMRASMVSQLVGRVPSVEELDSWKQAKLDADPFAFGARPTATAVGGRESDESAKPGSEKSMVPGRASTAGGDGGRRRGSTQGGGGPNMRDVLQWAKDKGHLDEAKLLAMARRVIGHFTTPYTQLHVGKGKGSLKEGGSVAVALPEACRLLREIDLPFMCYCEQQHPDSLTEESTKGLQVAWASLPAEERKPYVEQAAILLHGDDTLPRLHLTQPKRTHAEAWAAASAETQQRYIAKAARAWTADYRRTVDVFDFSERKCMKCAAEVVTKVKGRARARGPLLVLPVGDALQEPFWPEGLGVNRGCHNALDACWVANKWGSAAASEPSQRQLLQERQYVYQEFSLQMHGKNRKMLKGYRSDNTKVSGSSAHKEYSSDPASRYNNYHDRAKVEWAAAARAGPIKGNPNLHAAEALVASGGGGGGGGGTGWRKVGRGSVEHRQRGESGDKKGVARGNSFGGKEARTRSFMPSAKSFKPGARK